jgi:hypothetical protein
MNAVLARHGITKLKQGKRTKLIKRNRRGRYDVVQITPEMLAEALALGPLIGLRSQQLMGY